MQIRYYKEYSRFLNRFMEFKVYGHAGRPIVILSLIHISEPTRP